MSDLNSVTGSTWTRKMPRAFFASLMLAMTAACATTVDLSVNAQAQLQAMSQADAEALLRSFVEPDSGSGAVCLIGQKPLLTRLNYEVPPVVTGAVIDFSGTYAALAGVEAKGDMLAGEGQVFLSYGAKQGEFSVDTRTLKEVRILAANDALLRLCRGFQPGFVVALKPAKGLPDQGEISINAKDQAALDTLLAVLRFFSPQARLAAGIGM